MICQFRKIKEVKEIVKDPESELSRPKILSYFKQNRKNLCAIKVLQKVLILEFFMKKAL